MRKHKFAVLAALLALGGGIAIVAVTIDDGDGEDKAPVAAPAPEVIVREVPVPEDTDDLGFPAFATKNTTRVAGPDPISDAAAVALAVFPSTGGVAGPSAVTLVDVGDWQSGSPLRRWSPSRSGRRFSSLSPARFRRSHRARSAPWDRRGPPRPPGVKC